MRIIRLPGPSLGRGWFHFCPLDRECRKWGTPVDLYIHPLRIILRFSEGSSPDKWREITPGESLSLRKESTTDEPSQPDQV